METITVYFDGLILGEVEVPSNANEDQTEKFASALLPKGVHPKTIIVLHKFVSFVSPKA